MRLPQIAAVAVAVAAAVALPVGSASASDLSTGHAPAYTASQQHHIYEPAVMNASPSKVMPGASVTFDGAVATHNGKPAGHITKIVSYGFANAGHTAVVTNNDPLDFTATAVTTQTPGTYTAYLYTSDHPANAAAIATFKVLTPASNATIRVDRQGAANGQQVTITGTGASTGAFYSVISDAFAGKGAEPVKVNADGTYTTTATVSNTPGRYNVSLYANGKQLVSTPFTIVLLGGPSAD
jgi:hypothetical protein